MALILIAPPVSVKFLVNPALHDGDDPALMNDLINAVNNVAEEFPEVRGITVTTEPMSNWFYALATSGHPAKITINHNYADNPAEFTRLINKDVELHFHPALGHCSGPQLLAYHESAHIIDFARGNVADDLLHRRFGEGQQLHGTLSGYSFRGETGSINAPEALAEAFAAVRCDGGNWAEQELYHMLVG